MPGLVFYGMSDSTPAMRAVFARGLNGRRAAPRRRRKARKATKAAAPRKARRARAARPAKLMKGSAAAKRYMAKLRAKAMRKRRA